MPDANKLKVLQNAGYVVKPTCATCVHREAFYDHPWTTCNLLTYEHQKHTGEPRGVSIFKTGWCKFHEWSKEILEDLQTSGFLKFVEKN